MRAQPFVLAGGPVARVASATFFFASCFFLSSGVANAQFVSPEPGIAASTEAMDFANSGMEYDALGMSAPSGGAPAKPGDKPAPAAAAECPSLSDCECYSPCWTIRAGTLFLDRDPASRRALVTETADPASTALLNAGQLDPGVAWGFEVSAIRHQFLGTRWDLEGRYFGIDGWNAVVGPVAAPAGSTIQFATPVALPGAADLTASYHSELRNAEINFRRPVNDWLQLLLGVRYMGLNENLAMNADFGGTAVTGRVRTTNDLWGFQLGADATLWSRDRLTIEMLGKAGVFNNSIVSHTTIDADFADGRLDHTAFVGEVGLTGCYQLSRSWSLRAGYQVLWMEGVALAPDQVPGVNLTTNEATVQTDGSPFYHGAFLGLELRR